MFVYNAIERYPSCPICQPAPTTGEKFLEAVVLILVILFFVFVIEVIRYFTGRRRHGERDVEFGRVIDNGNNFYI